MKTDYSKLMVVRKFSSYVEANIVKTLLDSLGVECELVNDSVAGLFPGNPGEVFQINLLAREEDVSRIEALLKAKFDKTEMK